MGIDRESINLHLKELRDCIDKLKPISKVDRNEFVNDTILQDVAERNLQVAIQSCLDIGNHVISACGMSLPMDYSDIFMILGKEKVIPMEFALKIAPMSGLRNLLVHEYLQIDLNNIYEVLQKIDDFAKFGEYILNFVKQTVP